MRPVLAADPNLLERACVIIPTLNAEPFLKRMLPVLRQQGIAASQVFIIDSSSTDSTASLAHDFGARVEIIDRNEFNHGGTRRRAARALADFDILVYLTQDAIPAASNTICRLVESFHDHDLGMAYGRQLPRQGATPIERHARLYNYSDISEVRGLEDRKRLGIKTCFCSNSFAAYRQSALEQVGSFPEDAYFAEDQIVAGKLLLAGWKIAYRADAQVFHSHGYTLVEEFRRYFDVGVFHARNPWLLDTFGSVEGDGFKFLGSELKYLLRYSPQSIPSALLRTVAKYSAYKLGREEAKLSNSWKRRLGMQAFYWKALKTQG